MTEQRRDFSQAERDKLAKEGKALPDGSYPIENVQDLHNAIQAVGRASNKAAAVAHIKKRAKALGATAELPEDWRAFQPDEPDADNMGGPDDGDADNCSTCDGSGKVEGETCMDCGGSGEAGGPQQNSEDSEQERRDAVAERIKGTVERRELPAEMELREVSDGSLRFSGYASTSETPYKVGPFEETFARGAFKRTLGEDPDVVLRVEHGGLPLARTRSGTMTLSEDVRGLRVDATLDPSDPDVQALLPKMKRKDLTEMSFAFRATDEEWDEKRTKRLVREATIHRGDVSIVTHGANHATSATVTLRAVVEDMEQRAGRTISKATKKKVEALIEQAEELIAEPEPKPEPPEPVGAAQMFAGRSIEEMKRRRARVR